MSASCRVEVVLLCLGFAMIALRITLLGNYGSAMRMRIHKVNSALGQAKHDAELLAASDSLIGAMSRRAMLPLIWFKSINERSATMAVKKSCGCAGTRLVERVRGAIAAVATRCALPETEVVDSRH